MSFIRRAGAVIYKWFASALEPHGRHARAAWIATMSVAETLLTLVNSKVVPDIRRLIDSEIEGREADTLGKKAQANEAMARAAEAANQSTRHKRKDALARAEQNKALEEVEKLKAETAAIKSDTKNRRLQVEIEAKARLLEAQTKLIEAVSRLKQEGGELFVDKENLKLLLSTSAPAVDDLEASDPGSSTSRSRRA